jgi:hypothetical protein
MYSYRVHTVTIPLVTTLLLLEERAMKAPNLHWSTQNIRYGQRSSPYHKVVFFSQRISC